MPEWTIRLLETPEAMMAVEDLQRIVWPGSEIDIVPTHILLTMAHNGGLVIGAYVGEQLVGAVFGFPGLYYTPDGPRSKHCSQQLGVHPDWRNSGIGFALKRAQWQMVRHQGLDRITWTYDPLLSLNARLNITKLGAVCNTYRRSEYGEMRDGLNIGLPSDRFQVDWWVNTERVARRLSRQHRKALSLDHFLAADVSLYAASPSPKNWPQPPNRASTLDGNLLLMEIPTDFLALKGVDIVLAREWRLFSREFFESAFVQGYLVTDFVYERSGNCFHSYYVLTHGESTLEM